MFFKKYNSIMAQPEQNRNRWALGLSMTLSILIFVSFGFYKGYLSFGNGYVAPQKQVANVISADLALSPMQSTKESFKAAFEEIDKQYIKIKDSMANVLVPFMTGIEVYERK